MRYKQPVKQILIATRSCWDHSETRLAVRQNFDKVTKCGTLALGAEVFASENEEKKVPHTCKARPCPRCGHRATIQWQREQWCSLPDIPYAGIVLTMPDVLWPIFRQNRHLLHHLPKLGATVIQQWAKLKYGVRLLIMVIPHTFGARLNFNSHLHILVSAGGLQESEGCWVTSLVFDEEKLMHMWRFAVITFLREALLAKALTSNLSNAELRNMLRTQYERWWSIDIDHFASKEHFLRYAGRYVRRPPIAQYRFVKITDREVRFWTKDKIQKRRVNISFTPRGIRGHFGRTGSEPLPTCDSLLRSAGAQFKSSDLYCCVLVAGTTEAPSPTTIELGVFAAKGLWSGSPHRQPRQTDALDWSAESLLLGGLPDSCEYPAPCSGHQPSVPGPGAHTVQQLRWI